MADGSESIKPVGEADGGEAAGTEVQETGASSRGGPQDVLADPGPVAKTPDSAQKSVEQAVVQPQGESPIIAAPVSDPAAESVSEVKPSGPEAEPSEVKASAEKASEQGPGDADGNHKATRDDEGVKADGVAGKLEQSAVKEDGVAQNATASATRPIAPDLVPKEKETEAEQPTKPAEAAEVPKASASVLSAVTEATTVPSGPATSQVGPSVGVPMPAQNETVKHNQAEIEALEAKANEAKAEAEKASDLAMAAVVQANALATSVSLPYAPPMPIPSQMLPQGNAPSLADVQRLEAQAAAVQSDILQRREAVRQQQQREEMERRQASQTQPQRPTPLTTRERSQSPQEREMPPRRAASARAAKVFKKDADDYLSDSPPDSPPESPRPKKTPPKPKPQVPPPVAKPAQSKDSGASAWEEAPKQQMVLKMSEINKGLQKKWLQLYWPDDGKWWPCQVVFVDTKKKTANVLYETGEEEADLELADLVQKGEVAWLNKNDAQKEETQSRGRKQDDRDEPKGRGRKPLYDEGDEDDEGEEDGWGPGRKRRAAAKSKPKYEEPESEPESSDSESLPPSDQSSDWRSSEDDDKPAKKRPKKKRKASRPSSRVPQQSHHYHHQSHGRERMGSHNEPPVNNRNIMGRGGIFDDEPGFGGSFGGGMDPMRSQSQRNPGSLSREQMQMGWGAMGGQQQRQGGQMAGAWNRPQGSEQLLQQQNRQQQMNNNLGQLHIPQVAMQGGQVLDLQRYQAAAAQAQAQAQGMRASMPMGWRPQPGQDMRQTDWAALQQNPMFRLQMGQHAGQMNPQQGAGNLQMHQLQLLQQQQMQRLAAQQQQQQQAQQQQHSQQPGQSNDAATQRNAGQLGPATKNMEGIVAAGMNSSGKTVEVQQHSSGQWARGTIMATMARGPSGGSAIVHFDSGEQRQFAVNDEGRAYNIRMP